MELKIRESLKLFVIVLFKLSHNSIFRNLPDIITSHLTNAFPLVPGGHEQIGIWLTVSHSAPEPQVPSQGSRQ